MKNNILVIPAPTAASVIAKSGDSMKSQITDITKLYAVKIMSDTNKLFVIQTERAHITKNATNMYWI
jgi:hypothetical protein